MLIQPPLTLTNKIGGGAPQSHLDELPWWPTGVQLSLSPPRARFIKGQLSGSTNRIHLSLGITMSLDNNRISDKLPAWYHVSPAWYDLVYSCSNSQPNPRPTPTISRKNWHDQKNQLSISSRYSDWLAELSQHFMSTFALCKHLQFISRRFSKILFGSRRVHIW